jgi:hypothetical protein
MRLNPRYLTRARKFEKRYVLIFAIAIVGSTEAGVGAEKCRAQGFLHVEPAAAQNAWRKLLAGCFCAHAVDVTLSFVGGVIAARGTAPEPARGKPAATYNGKLGNAIRRLPVVVPCMPNAVVATAPDSSTVTDHGPPTSLRRDSRRVSSSTQL